MPRSVPTQRTIRVGMGSDEAGRPRATLRGRSRRWPHAQGRHPDGGRRERRWRLRRRPGRRRAARWADARELVGQRLLGTGCTSTHFKDLPVTGLQRTDPAMSGGEKHHGEMTRRFAAGVSRSTVTVPSRSIGAGLSIGGKCAVGRRGPSGPAGGWHSRGRTGLLVSADS